MIEDLNTVLAAYSDARGRPGGARLDDWVRRYPQHARALAAFAADSAVFDPEPRAGDDDGGDAAVVRDRRATYIVDVDSHESPVASTPAAWRAPVRSSGFDEPGSAFLRHARAVRERMQPYAARAPLRGLLLAARECGMSIDALAGRLGVGRSQVAKLDRRLLRAATIPVSLVTDLASLLGRPFDEVSAYLRLPPTLSPQAATGLPGHPGSPVRRTSPRPWRARGT